MAPLQISVIVSLLNEEGSLKELMAWIARVMQANDFTYEVIFIDDGSTDRSWEILKELTTEYEQAKAVKFRRNYGKSAALYTGFAKAEGAVVITMDADLQDSPDEIPELYRMITEDGYDLVSGWKKKRYDPVLTKNLPSKLYNATVRMATGIQLHDMNCGLKAYRNAVVKSVEVYGEMHRYIPVLAKYAGFKKIGEKPVVHQERKYGVSKFGIERFIRGPLDLMSVLFLCKFGKRPMHFFGMVGLGFLALWGLLSLYLVGAAIFGSDYPIVARPAFYIDLLCFLMGTGSLLLGCATELTARTASERNAYLIEETIK